MCYQVQKSCISTLPWGLLFPPTTVLFRFVILGLGRLRAFLRTSHFVSPMLAVSCG